MNMPLRFELPEQKLSPADDHEWTNRDKAYAVERLVDRIMDGEPWDENNEGYKADMFCEWENIMLNKHLSPAERMARIRDAHWDYVSRYARERVELNPNKYCEESED